MSKTEVSKNSYLNIAFIPLAVGINLGVSTIIQLLKLPIFLDSIGTILTAILLGWRSGAIVGVLSFIISTITVFPPAVYFSGTQICIAVYIYLIGSVGGLKTIPKTILSGVGLALVAAIASAPVIYYLFGGITGNGISVFTLYLEARHFAKGTAVIISGITAELIDKVAQCLIALFILRSLPMTLLKFFKNQRLIKNNFYEG